MSDKQIVLSGIRATGNPHLGNHLGAFVDFVELDKDPTKDCMFFIANWHTLTTRPDPETMERDLRDIVLTFLATGIDPERSTIFAQSSVPETAILSMLLSNLTPVAKLEGMHHWKEKKDRLEKEGLAANAGLLGYPVLMAADILGPLADLVPVGEDQHAHVELARVLAKRFNSRYGELFPVPELLERSAVRVPSLDASGKMSKSDSSGTILLDDTPDLVELKFKRAVTDPQRQRLSDPGDPRKCNIFTYHHMVSSGEEIAWAGSSCRTAAIGCVECKMVVAKHVNKILAPIQERKAELLASGFDVMEILHEGGKRARALIRPTVERASEMMGVRGY